MTEIKNMTTGVILAGGKGMRMNGEDKGLIELAGKPLIEHVIAAFDPQVATLLINANRNLPVYQSYGYPVIRDKHPDFQGPLAGVETALSAAHTPYLATVPCDSPNPPADLVERLSEALLDTDSDLAVADDGRRMHPVFCLMKTSLLDSLREQLAGGERKIDRWFEKIKAARCNFEHERDAFHNINTPQDLSQTRSNA